MYVFCNNEESCNKLKFTLAGPLAILGFSNSLLNPIIYAWFHIGFRVNATRLLKRKLENSRWCICFSNNSEVPTSNEVSLSTRITNSSLRTEEPL